MFAVEPPGMALGKSQMGNVGLQNYTFSDTEIVETVLVVPSSLISSEVAAIFTSA